MPALRPLFAISSGSVFSGARKTKLCNSMIGKAEAISPLAPILTAISPSIARLVNELKSSSAPLFRISLAKIVPLIGPSIPNWRKVPEPVHPTL